MKKVLRAIGGFFAKIGRWIANTAWIQPLLIVGGIFAIIFSIPYIKTAIENDIASKQVNVQQAYYTNHKLSLINAEKGTSQVDTLFDNIQLLSGSPAERAKAYQDIKSVYGEKFFISFAQEDCANCRECSDGFITLESRFAEYGLAIDEEGDLLPAYKFYAIMVDDMISDSTSEFDGKYRAKFVFENHQELLDDIVAEYVDGSSSGEYALFNNVSESNRTSLKSSIEKLQNAIDNNGEGLDVPTTFMVDLTQLDERFNVNGITAIFFNYTSLMEDTVNKETKGQFLRDCWAYKNLFDEDYKK